MIHVFTIMMLVLVPIGAAALLRACGVSGWPVLGGVVAGIVIGPTIFGRVMPSTYEQMMVGAVAEREQLSQVIRRHEADRMAHEQSDAPGGVYDALLEQQAGARAALERDVALARSDHQMPVRVFALTVVAVTLLTAGMMRADGGQPRPDWMTPLSIGLWASLLPGAMAYTAARLWWTDDVATALLTGACVAIGPWVLTPLDRRIADDAEIGGSRLIRTSGQVASIIAMAAALFVIARDGGPLRLAAVGATTALVVGWVLPPLRMSAARSAVQWIVLPTLAGLAAVRLDVISDFHIWPAVALVLLSGDGRWLGAYLGAALPGGRRSLPTMALVLGMMATGPTQLALLAVALHLDLLPAGIGLAVLFGAVYVEAAGPLRRTFARRMFETQNELDALDDELP